MPQMPNPQPTSIQKECASPRLLWRALKHAAIARKLEKICNAFENKGVYGQALKIVASPTCRATTTQKIITNNLRGIAIPLETMIYCRLSSVINFATVQNRLAAGVCRGGDRPFGHRKANK